MLLDRVSPSNVVEQTKEGCSVMYDVIIVGGLGHIGLPFGIALADTGLKVALYDTDEGRRRIVARGEMPFLEYDAEPILKRVINRTLHLSTDIRDVANSESVVITIGTPLDEYLNPKLLPILTLAEQLIPHLHHDHHVMLRSTVYPGSSERMNAFFESEGLRLHLSFCPERVVQGYAMRELGRFPQIVSGFTDEAIRRAESLFRRLGSETVVVKVREAELAKLFSNAWRYVSFAITNQFYMMATEQGVDYKQVHHALTYNYERAKGIPTPGFTGGPCLLKDTMQLAAYSQNSFSLGHAAVLINEGLPNFIVKVLRQHYGHLREKKVGILGMAFKADIDDIRDSLSYKLVKILKFYGASVFCSDEFVKDPAFVTKEELITTCPTVIVGAPHSAYKGIKIPKETYLIDLWGIV
jgi:UDP-N-acetyl-D-mannosaminuronic acid dehydrogenase